MAVLLAAFLLLQPVTVPVPGAAGAAPPEATTPDTAVADTIHARGIARPDTVLPRPCVTVTATPGAVSMADAPARVTVLGRRAIAGSGATSVAELLEARSGAFVRRYGMGGLSTLSLRGGGAAQSLVLLNGHRLTDPQLGQLDLSLLPTLLLESVEVAHGAGSALHGAGAIGGAVNLRTRTAARAPVAALSASYGAYGERRGSLMASAQRGRLSALALAEHEQAEGNFPYTNEALLPARTVRRQNADRRRLTLFSSVSYAGRRHLLRAGSWYTAAERGLAGTAGTAPTGERQEDEALRLWLDDDVRMPWGGLRFGGLFQRKALRYRDPARETDDTGRTLVASAEAEAHVTDVRTPVGPWRLSGGVTGSYAQARHPSLRGSARDGHAGLFAGGQGRVGPARLFPMLRADAYVSSRGPARIALSPEVGANLKAFSFACASEAACGGLHLKASAGRAFRRPTLNDRYWQPGGNPDLRPERSWNADAGLFVQQPRRQGELTVFARRTLDEIVWEPSGEGYYAPRNVGRVRVLGLEASMQQAWRLAGADLQGGLFYTLTDARDRTTPGTSTFGQPLRYVPRHQFKAHLRATAGPAALMLGVRYVGRRYANSDGTRPLDPFFVADTRVQVTHAHAGIQATLSLDVENVFNTDYEVLQNRPLPPRHARLRLTLKTHSD